MQKKALNFFLHLIYYGTVFSTVFQSPLPLACPAAACYTEGKTAPEKEVPP